MAKFLSSVLYGIVWVFSLLPMPILYLFSDIMWLVMFLCPPLRYRKKVVQKNLAMAFPDKDRKWLRRTERRFYYQFSCQIMESLKTASVGERWIKRHMEITGCDRIVEEARKGRSGFGYLGHVGNWVQVRLNSIKRNRRLYRTFSRSVNCLVVRKRQTITTTCITT